ncbi:hypothetical protein BJ138DRAFT_1163411 [Hygrophoropsis aurantiaca]|uniref:Uncharacterized protein n=1 Tax=Hygrophoropsis aurantiaca TaxID=72124 RepID=A0ACB7ZZL1_9AGAM|nr:hypothetical protein BJ138DRAFT_1163411 [Hygrophoropsis aurantiaca]
MVNSGNRCTHSQNQRRSHACIPTVLNVSSRGHAKGEQRLLLFPFPFSPFLAVPSPSSGVAVHCHCHFHSRLHSHSRWTTCGGNLTLSTHNFDRWKLFLEKLSAQLPQAMTKPAHGSRRWGRVSAVVEGEVKERGRGTDHTVPTGGAAWWNKLAAGIGSGSDFPPPYLPPALDSSSGNAAFDRDGGSRRESLDFMNSDAKQKIIRPGASSSQTAKLTRS